MLLAVLLLFCRLTPDAVGPLQATARLPAGAPVAPTATWPDPAESTSVGVENFPPHVKQHMRQLLLVAGKEFRVRVPERTFEDLESGLTRQLVLTLRHTGGAPLHADDWIQFDTDKQEIYGL